MNGAGATATGAATAAAPSARGDWLSRLRAGERQVLARAITAVENESAEANAILGAIFPHLGRALVIGVTGVTGTGKSTLVGALIAELRGRGLSVGVVAVDPSSPFSGGAILGDRIRMQEHAGDDAVFVRSLASRGHLGGLSRTAARVVDVMDAAGKEVVVVETVGAGQADVEIAELAHTKIVVSAPGLGDDIQAIKAGILEIADILVVNKNDLPLASRTLSELEGMVGLIDREGWRPPVLATTATTGEGVPELADAIFAHADWLGEAKRRASPRLRVRRVLAAIAAERVRARVLDGAAGDLDAICDQVLKGELDFDQAAARALDLAGEG
ncbi:MAG: methylmalonyl Co-A mutase-associated GTPase MeaB [Alphaproteobacteria bacterium]|nr:methylmalonyl Co-A mutase-associated GTPase MeaB [Alphaproteobacteria bacterium]